jgi:hypothetical protein
MTTVSIVHLVSNRTQAACGAPSKPATRSKSVGGVTCKVCQTIVVRLYGERARHLYDPMTKALRAQTLKCEDCAGIAYAIWSRPADPPKRKPVRWGLCKPCEDKMRVECAENRRALGLS